jgi:hypothetical protein
MRTHHDGSKGVADRDRDLQSRSVDGDATAPEHADSTPTIRGDFRGRLLRARPQNSGTRLDEPGKGTLVPLRLARTERPAPDREGSRRRRGRSRNAPDGLRDHALTVRLNNSVFRRFKACADARNVPASTLLWQMVTGELPASPLAHVDMLVVNQLRRIGNNLSHAICALKEHGMAGPVEREITDLRLEVRGLASRLDRDGRP